MFSARSWVPLSMSHLSPMSRNGEEILPLARVRRAKMVTDRVACRSRSGRVTTAPDSVDARGIGTLGGPPGDLYVFVRVNTSLLHPARERHPPRADDQCRTGSAWRRSRVPLRGEEELTIPAGTQTGGVSLKGRGVRTAAGRPRRRDRRHHSGDTKKLTTGSVCWKSWVNAGKEMCPAGRGFLTGQGSLGTVG